jgi:hypothetical protein
MYQEEGSGESRLETEESGAGLVCRRRSGVICQGWQQTCCGVAVGTTIWFGKVEAAGRMGHSAVFGLLRGILSAVRERTGWRDGRFRVLLVKSTAIANSEAIMVDSSTKSTTTSGQYTSHLPSLGTVVKVKVGSRRLEQRRVLWLLLMERGGLLRGRWGG